jgi:hypothetical protein
VQDPNDHPAERVDSTLTRVPIVNAGTERPQLTAMLQLKIPEKERPFDAGTGWFR